MNQRPRLLDLFCGAGGCSVGYHRAGFDVVGVDNRPMPSYPFEFEQRDALEALACLIAGGPVCGLRLNDFAAIHASPPCQRYSNSRHIHNSGDRHPDLVEPCRDLLQSLDLPWVIENVIGAPVHRPVVLCGLMFGLKVLRHRVFESNECLLVPRHPRHPRHLRTGTLTTKRGGKGNGYSTGAQGLVTVAGNNFDREAGAKAMGIDWMPRRAELAQAIPPAYTEFLGRQLLRVCQKEAVA